MPCAIAYFYNPKFTKTRATPLQKRKDPYARSPCNSPIRTVCRAPQTIAHNFYTNTNWRPSEQFLCLSGRHTHPEYSSRIYLLFAIFYCRFLLSLTLRLGCFFLFVSILNCALQFCGSTNRSYLAHRKMTIVKLINFHMEADVNAVILFCIVRSAKKKWKECY